MEPVNWLVARDKNVNLEEFVIDSGITPPRLFASRIIASKLGSADPISNGRLPVKKLNPSLIVLSVVMLKIPIGMEPFKLLYVR